MSRRIPVRTSGNAANLSPALWDSLLLRACRGAPNPRPPVWLMRQAGRYMQHYRGIRKDHGFLDLCKDPALATEVTLFARDWLGVDAAIIFSDILVVLESLGLPLSFGVGEGPRLDRPIRSAAAVDALGDPQQAAAELGYVRDAIAMTVRGLPADIPCLGFCGAPFTLASYAIEGGGSRQFAATKRFMYAEPAAWHRLLARIAETCAAHLRGQVAAGASAVQVFDSWAGVLTADDYAEFVLPHLASVVAGVPSGIPVIVFGTGATHLLPLMQSSGADVVGFDQTADLVRDWDALGGSKSISVQGNLDPTLLLAPRERLTTAADRMLAQAGNRPGWICNLGHGVLKETDPDMARLLVDRVKLFRA